MQQTSTIELYKEEMKFSAGHFTVFSATQRENIHGHNFSIYVALEGVVGANGMLGDDSEYKRWIIDRCQQWNETFLLPGESPYLSIERTEQHVTALFNDERIPFLIRDVTVLPATNITIEELARLFGEGLCSETARLHHDRIVSVVVKCSSGPGQEASWRKTIVTAGATG